MKKLLKILLQVLNSKFDYDFRYIAIDANGEVFAYTKKPVHDSVRKCYDIDDNKNDTVYIKIAVLKSQRASIYSL